MKFFKTLLGISVVILLASCGSGSSSSGGSDQNALRCVDLSDRGNIVDVGNTCDRDINVRFFGNNTGWFLVSANSSVPIDSAKTTATYGACFAPYNPRTESGSQFSCQK